MIFTSGLNLTTDIRFVLFSLPCWNVSYKVNTTIKCSKNKKDLGAICTAVTMVSKSDL